MTIRQDCTYAGIGSRSTPLHVCYQMTELAQHLHDCGWTLRSGGADGADAAFEKGAGSRKEIFLATDDIPEEAFTIAAENHPRWQALAPYVKKLHARNAQQILGGTLNAPSKFVVCWTPDGVEINTTAKTGGTGQAIRIANAFDIPVYNLAIDGRFEQIKDICDCALMQYSDYY